MPGIFSHLGLRNSTVSHCSSTICTYQVTIERHSTSTRMLHADLYYFLIRYHLSANWITLLTSL